MSEHRLSISAAAQPRTKSAGALALPAAALKALDAAVQGMTGLMLLIVPGSVLSGVRNTLATRDMVTDPQHLFATHIDSAAERTLPAAGNDHMVLIYGLFLVAVVKLAVAVAVLLRARGAVVVAVVVYGALTLFEAVQAFGGAAEPALPVITALDAAVVVALAARLFTARRA